MEFTRREALAAAVTGVVAGTAGCAGVLDGAEGDGDGDGETNDRLRGWVPASQDGDGGGVSPGRSVQYHDYTAYGDRSYDPVQLLGDGRRQLRPLGIEPDAVEADVSVTAGTSRSTVFFGSFDPESVRSSLDGERVGEHQGATLLRSGASGTGGATYGVTDSAVVVGQARSAEAAAAAVRRLLDTDAGEVDRAATGGDFEAALAPVESEDYVSVTEVGATGNASAALQGVVAAGVGATLQSERIGLTQVYVYESAEATDVDGIRNGTQLGAGYDSVSYETDGRTVTLTATFDPAAAQQGSQPDVPQVAFDFEYDDETGRVRITHTGGDVITTDNSASVTVSVAGTSADWLAAAEDGEISAGDEFVVGPNGDLVTEGIAGETIRVVWTPPGGGESTVIATFSLPA
jgi:hypothetical protein